MVSLDMTKFNNFPGDANEVKTSIKELMIDLIQTIASDYEGNVDLNQLREKSENVTLLAFNMDTLTIDIKFDDDK